MSACIDCEPGSRRPAPNPGPRCATHHRAVVKARRAAAKDTRIVRVYRLDPGDYDRLRAAQGGRCYVCRRATGASKALAVDHDHSMGFQRAAVRALLCSPCNRAIGHLRDSPAAMQRMIDVVTLKPAQAVLDPLPQPFSDSVTYGLSCDDIDET